MEAPHFSGWATKANLKCSDGRTITPEAFQHMDGVKVPLVWQHRHNDSSNVLGHGILSARPEGVWVDGYLNDTVQGLNMQKLVKHKDIDTLSIFANGLVEKAKQVFHGTIREVSLVLSGANPGAKIENIRIAHSEFDDPETLEDEAIIWHGEALFHDDEVDEDDEDADEDEAEDDEDDDDDEDLTVQDVFDSFTDEQVDVVHAMIGSALGGGELSHSDVATIKDVYDGFSDVQKNVVHYMIGAAVEAAGDKTAAHSATDGDNTDEDTLDSQEGSTIMHRNTFEDNDGGASGAAGGTLIHDALSAMATDMRKGQTLKSVLAHAEDYGVNNIELLFPEARALANSPEVKSRQMEWVTKVLDGTKHTPFAKVKSLVFDITAAEARAKGYVTGAQKVDEVIQLLRRTTGPTTIYKKQRLDRDDVIDITDMNIVAFLHAEMTLMIKEELARAVLVGDGRSVSDPDKVKDPAGSIDGNGIRSIRLDDDLYAVKEELAANVSTKDQVTGIVRARAKYRGSGSPTAFVSDLWLTDVMLLEDKMGRPRYESIQSLADAMRVKEIVPVEIFAEHPNLVCILVNLVDYSIGTNSGGELTSFEDFDIDVNQHKYLQETRLSGGLTKPFSAVVVTRVLGVAVTPTAPSFNGGTNTITIPTVTGVTYTIDEEAVSGSVVITEDVEVVAVADSGKYIPAGTVHAWSYTYTP